MTGFLDDSIDDPDEQGHPDVNSAPQRRRSPMEGGSIHIVVGKSEHFSRMSLR